MQSWRTDLVLLLGATLFVLLAFILMARSEGNYPPGALHSWFDKLASGKGLCCSFADGVALADPDWGTDRGHYWVEVDGQLLNVDDEAVVTEPNKYGPAVVWPYKAADGLVHIRCFLPGSGA